jgi:hypothetical protein
MKPIGDLGIAYRYKRTGKIPTRDEGRHRLLVYSSQVGGPVLVRIDGEKRSRGETFMAIIGKIIMNIGTVSMKTCR